MKKKAIITSLSFLIGYLIITFITWEFNPSKMNEIERFTILLIGFVITFLLNLIKHERSNQTKA